MDIRVLRIRQTIRIVVVVVVYVHSYYFIVSKTNGCFVFSFTERDLTLIYWPAYLVQKQNMTCFSLDNGDESAIRSMHKTLNIYCILLSVVVLVSPYDDARTRLSYAVFVCVRIYEKRIYHIVVFVERSRLSEEEEE